MWDSLEPQQRVKIKVGAVLAGGTIATAFVMKQLGKRSSVQSIYGNNNKAVSLQPNFNIYCFGDSPSREVINCGKDILTNAVSTLSVDIPTKVNPGELPA